MSRCPLCAGETARPVFVKNGYTIAQCADCQLQYVDPIPTDEAIRAHYQSASYFEGSGEQGYRSYADMRKALLPFFERRMRTINARVSSRGRLLDFGCAAGYFLEVARQHGWQVAGVELSAEMARKAAQRLGAPVVTSLDQLSDEPFDVITLWEVIEHLAHPIEQLRILHRRLRPNGLLMLSTPNTGHWQALRRSAEWVGYQPPSHLLFFTAETLTSALTQAGFERVRIERVSPLPPLPSWLERATAGLQASLTSGQARRWKTALYAWRIARLAGWGWQKIAHRNDDIFTTLEAVACKP